MLLFLADICEKTGGKDCVEKILSGDMFEMVHLYSEKHHSDIDRNTEARIKKALVRILWYPQEQVDSLILISPRPKPRPQQEE